MSAQSTALNASSVSYRANLYRLAEGNSWTLIGAGLCVYTEGNGDEPDQFLVRSEVDSTTLVSSYVFADSNHREDEGTRIVWFDAYENFFAMLFENAEGRDDIWGRIRNKRGEARQTHAVVELPGGDDADAVILNGLTLPTPTKGNLGVIARTLENATLEEKGELAVFILEDNYVTKLFPIFEDCEKLSNTKQLHELFTVMKAIIFLCDSNVIGHITDDENMIPVASILEYDPATPTMKANHRDILKEHLVRQPIVNLDNPDAMLTIRQTYRFQYLKDVIMARYLDADLSSTLESLTKIHHLITLAYIQQNVNFQRSVFAIIHRRDTDEINRTRAIQVVLQICTISKSLDHIRQARLYRMLTPHGLFIAIEIAISSGDSGMRKAGVGALCSIVDADAHLVRSHILNQQQRNNAHDDNSGNDKRSLIQCIINQLTLVIDPGLEYQYCDILKETFAAEIDPPADAWEETKILHQQTLDGAIELFYDKYAPSILEPLMSMENNPMKLEGATPVLVHGRDQGDMYCQLLGLLRFVIEAHPHRSKDWILSGDLFVKVVQLYRSRYSEVKLAALRFFRYCVGQTDGSYHQHLIKHNVFEPTIRLLLDTKGNGNTVNSNCLELLKFITFNNLKVLVSHLIDRFGSVLDTVDYISTCSDLRKQYNKNQEQRNESTSLESSSQSDTTTNSLPSNEGSQSTSLDQSEGGCLNSSAHEDKQRLADISNTIDQPSLSVSPQPSAAPSQEEGRQLPLEETATAGEYKTTAIDSEANTTEGPSEPVPSRPPTAKRDHEEPNEDDILLAKVSKQSGLDNPSVLKRTPRPLLAGSDEHDTIATDKENSTKASTSKLLSAPLPAAITSDGKQTSEGSTTNMPLKSLKHKRDGEGDDEGDVLVAKASKLSGEDKPSVLKRTLTSLLVVTTSDDEQDAAATDNKNNTKPGIQKRTSKRLLRAKTAGDGQDAPATDSNNHTTGDQSLPMPSRSLKHERDDEGDVLSAKASKLSGEDKPSISKRTPASVLVETTGDGEQDATATDNKINTKPGIQKRTSKRLLRETTAGDGQDAPATDSNNHTTGDQSLPMPSRSLKRERDEEGDVLAAKASKLSGEDKPSISKRTPASVLVETTGDDKQVAAATDNKIYPKPSSSKRTSKRLLRETTSGGEQGATATDSRNSAKPSLPKRTSRRLLRATTGGGEQDATATDSRNSTKPSLPKRTSRRLLRATTGGGEQDATATDSRNSTKPSLPKRTSKRLMRSMTSDSEGSIAAIDNENYTKPRVSK